MSVPASADQLHVADTSFDHPAAHQAHLAVTVSRFSVTDAVEVLGLSGFAGEIDQLGCSRLHAEGELVVGDACVEPGITRTDGAVLAVPGVDLIEQAPLFTGRNRLVSREVLDRGSLDPHVGSLVDGRQEARAVHRGAVPEDAVGHCDVGWQVLALAAQSVDHPGSHAGMTEQLCARVHHDHRRTVNEQLVVHRPDDGQLVGVPGEPREDAGDLLATFAVLPEGELWCHHRGIGGVDLGQVVVLKFLGQKLPVELLHHRLGIERLELAGSALHEQEDHVAGGSGQVRWPLGQGGNRRGFVGQ